MVTRTESIERAPVAAGGPSPVEGGRGWDWLMVALGGWLVGGVYLDGWAHIHVPGLETFFTPWHAVLYSGFLAMTGALCIGLARGRRRGYSLARALPRGYGLSLVGALTFLGGGLVDMLWHILFGVESDLEALLSPTHLVLALGGSLMVTGPLRAALHRAADGAPGWLARLPMVLSLTLFLSLLTFFTEYASPYGSTWVATADRPAAGRVFVHQAIGLTTILFGSALLMGPVLVVVRRRPLPAGGLTLILLLNTTLMTVIHDKFLATGPGPLVLAAAGAGLASDLLSWRLRPSEDRVHALRVYAFITPALLYLGYFLAVRLTVGIWWSVHLWTGTIVLAGIVGWLLSYLLVPSPHWRDGSSPASP